MKTRVLALVAIAMLLLATGIMAYAEPGTLEFVEQALSVDTWEKLGRLGEAYGVYTVGCECDGTLYGNLSVGGFQAERGAAVLVDKAHGNACTLAFAPDAYDAVKAELTGRYGDAQTGADGALSWMLWKAEACLGYREDGTVELLYTAHDTPMPGQPSFPPTAAPTPAPTRAPQAAAVAQEGTFAFMEAASTADSWAAMLDLMRQHGLHGYASGCYADITGDLSIGGAEAEVVMIICGDHGDETVYETAGFDYDIWFEGEAYDAVKAALVQRYGQPDTVSEDGQRLTWLFQQTNVFLLRKRPSDIVVGYYLQPTLDASRPTFPPPAAAQATAAPATAEGFTADGGEYVAFMEQASLAYSRKALEAIGLQNGFAVEENKRGARLSGGLAVGGHAALYVDTCSPNGLPGFDCYAYFAPEAFDAVRAALTTRYGQPVAIWGAKDGYAWHFAEVDVSLKRDVAGMVEIRYAMQVFYNDFYPTFPPILEREDFARVEMPRAAADDGADALDFAEQAMGMASREALEALGSRYGLTIKESREGRYTAEGSLLVDGFAATECEVYRYTGPWFHASVDFAPEAYDAVLEALVGRYGGPRITWQHTPVLVWDFEGARVTLSRSFFDGEVFLYYGGWD